MNAAEFGAQWKNAIMNTYPVPPVKIERGEGAVLYDNDGTNYIDFLSGIAVNSLGYAHPAVVKAVSEQVAKFAHVSNLLGSQPAVDVAIALAERFSGGDSAVRESTRTFFCNSGAEANEAAFKIARKTGRRRILAAHHGFHGRTMGSLALTGQPDKKEAFHPFPGGVEFFPFGDSDYVRKLVDTNPQDTAAIIIEPIQGETGVIPAPQGFLKALREICDEHGILLIFDEVQTGAGRTGTFFAWEHEGVRPDILTLAKGLGAGLPIGACLAWGRAASLFQPGDHGTTFGGNPVACAAARVVLETLTPEFLAEVRVNGEYLAKGIKSLPGVKSVRGRGLMLAAQLEKPIAKQLVAAGLEAGSNAELGGGVILNATDESTLRFVPPLIITRDTIDEGLRRLKALIERQNL